VLDGLPTMCSPLYSCSSRMSPSPKLCSELNTGSATLPVKRLSTREPDSTFAQEQTPCAWECSGVAWPLFQQSTMSENDASSATSERVSAAQSPNAQQGLVSAAR